MNDQKPTKEQLEFQFMQACRDLNSAYLLRKRVGSNDRTREVLRDAIHRYRKAFIMMGGKKK